MLIFGGALLTAIVLLLLMWPLLRRMSKNRADAAGETAEGAQNGRAPSPMVIAAIIIGVATPVIAVALYLYGGAPGLPDRPAATARTAPQAEGREMGGNAPEAPDIEEMVAGLAARLADDPNDIEGWYRLARSYVVLGRREQAMAAYDHLQQVSGESAELLLIRARAERSFAGGRQTAESERLSARALELEPDNVEALWFTGVAKLRSGDRAGAEALFNRALAQYPPESPERQELQKLSETFLNAADNAAAAGGGGN